MIGLVLTLLMVSMPLVVAAPAMAETGGFLSKLLPDAPVEVDIQGPTVDDVSPHAVCGAVSNWIISSTVTCTNSNFIVSNYVQINSGGHLRLEQNTILRLNVPSTSWSYMIRVNSGGKLTVLNSTIQSNTGTRFYGIYVYSGGEVRYEGATIRDTYYYGTYAYQATSVKINDTTMTSGYYYGAYIGMTTGYIMNSTIYGYNYYGIYANNIANFKILNNTLRNCQYGAMMYTYNGDFYDNEIYSNTYYGIYLYNSRPYFENNYIHNNNQAGLYIYYSGMSLKNCTIVDNGNRDLWLESGGSKIEVHAINVEYEKAAFDVNNWGGSSKLYVYWYANVTVNWLSDDSPVVDADVTITDKIGECYPDELTTDANGEIKKIPLLEHVNMKEGKQERNPHYVNATGMLEDREITNYTLLSINKDGPNDAFQLLDDVPPPLVIETPEDNLLTNGTNITLTGSTEANNDPTRPVTLVVKLKSSTWTPTVNSLGHFSQFIPLGKDGSHSISVKAFDWMMNSMSATINVSKDTVNPPLEIITPKDMFLTNETTIPVEGTTECFAELLVNGVNVAVNDDGTWATTVDLVEGENTIIVKTTDPALNWIQKVRTVELDTTPPQLLVQEPIDGLKTNDRNLRIQGLTEQFSRVLINGNPVVVAGASFQTSYQLSEGKNTILVDSIDLAGNHNLTSKTVFLDTVPPALELYEPALNNLLVAQESIELKGFVDAGSKLIIDRVDVDLQGQWTYDVELREGKNKITVEAIDDVGNKVQIGRTVIRDMTPPMLAIFSPEDGFTFSESRIWIEGSAEPGANLTINGQATPTLNGIYSTTIDIVEGENKIILEAVDKAGNVNTETRTIFRDTIVNLEVDNEMQGKTVKKANITIKGETDPDAKVHINGEPVTVRSDGRFAHEVQLIEGNNTILVQAHDSFGNGAQEEMYIILKTPGGSLNTFGTGLGEDNSFLVWMLVLALMITAIAAIVGHNVYARKKHRDAEIQAQADAQAEALKSDSSVYEQLYGSEYKPSPNAMIAGTTGEPASGNGVHSTEPLDITPEAMAALYDAEDQLHMAEAQGMILKDAKRNLRLAKQFAKRGNSEKTESYAHKVMDIIDGKAVDQEIGEGTGPSGPE